MPRKTSQYLEPTLENHFRTFLSAVSDLQKAAAALLASGFIRETPALTASISRVLASAPELKNAIHQERIKTGLQGARDNGKSLGRPQLSVNEGRILQQLRSKESISAIAKDHKISRSTVRTIAGRLADRPIQPVRSVLPTAQTAMWLKTQMAKQKWTPRDVEIKGGPNHKTVQKILAGGSVYGNSLLKLAQAFGVDEGEIPRT